MSVKLYQQNFTVLYYAYFTCFNAISGLRRTAVTVSFTASIIYSSDLLTSVSLQQNIIDAAIDKWRKWLAACVCVQMDNIRNTFYEFLTRAKKNHGQINCN